MNQIAVIPKEELERKFNTIELAILRSENTSLKNSDSRIVNDLNDMVDYICKDVGIVVIDEYYRVRFIDLAMKYYSELSKSEIKLAFELSLIGELDDFLPKINGVADRNHYSRFSPEYAMKILNAYRKKKLFVKKRMEGAVPEPAEPTKEEIQQKFVEFVGFIDENIQRYMANGAAPRYINPIVVLKVFKLLGVTNSIPIYTGEKEQPMKRGGEAISFGTIAGKSNESLFLNKQVKIVYDYLIEKNKKLSDYVNTGTNDKSGAFAY